MRKKPLIRFFIGDYMSKKLKMTLLSIFSVMLILATCLFALPQFSVFADDTQIEDDSELTDNLVTSDEHFAYNGARLDPEQFAQGKYELGFKFDGVGTKWRDLSDYLPKSYKHPLMGGPYIFRSTATYKFKIFRDNTDGKTKTALGEYIIFFRTGYTASNSDAMFKAIYYKNLTYCNETFSVPADLNFYDLGLFIMNSYIIS